MRLALILFALMGAAPAAAGSITGPACVVDGDTLAIGGTFQRDHCVGGQRVRLHGIDAPEQKQLCRNGKGADYRCGQASTSAMWDMVTGAVVRCTERAPPDRYGRAIGECTAGRINVNAELVRQGWAIAYRRYSTEFVGMEDEARKAKRGMWAGQFTEPEQWRREHPRQ